MTIGVVGLGLIGGSMAKSIKKNTSYKVFGFDIDKSVTDYAILCNIIDGKLDNDTTGECDYVFVSLYPKDTVEYIKSHASYFKKGCVVIDCAGVKREVCTPCYKLAHDNGFCFIGGHPMAGTQFSGIKNSRDTMFHNACFVLVPETDEDIAIIDRARKLVFDIGFSRISVMNAQKHDKLIAFTSQLAHLVSSAYIKSPSVKERKGISAGSYKDLTRVAQLNEKMWTELFFENSDNLVFELDHIINELIKYRDALNSEDEKRMMSLLREGTQAKIEDDKR